MPLSPVKDDDERHDSSSKTLREYEALSHTLSSLETKDLNLVRDMDPEQTSGIWDAETRAFVDATTLKALFFSEDWVYITVDLVASKLASQWLRVMRRYVKDGEEVAEPAEGHSFTKVIEKPNQFQDYHSFMYVTGVDTVLEGNGIVWSGATKDRMILIPAESIAIDFDKAGAVFSYNVVDTNGGLEGSRSAGYTASFSVKEIAHIRRPNPSSYIWGLSPFIPARKSILFNRYSSEYLNNFYLKGATPGLALEMSDAANEATALRMLRSFEMAYTGRRNQRRTLVMPKGVSVKEVSHTLADQQLKEYINLNRETILGVLKVPKHELSLATAGSLGSEEYKTALKNFWAATLRPLQQLIAGTLTRHFQDVLGEGYYLDFDNSDVDVLQEDQNAKADLASKLLSTHTLNEVRSRVYQLPPVPGGDVVMGQLQPGGVNPFGLSVQNALAKAAEQRQLGEPVVASSDSPRQHESDDLAQKAREAAAERTLSTDWFQRRERMADDAAESGEKDLSEAIVSIWSDMAEGILKAVRKSVKKSLSTKAELPSKAELRKRLRAAMGAFEERWIDDALKVLESKADIGYDISLIVPFNLPDQDAIQALRERNASKRRAILEERGLFSFAKVNEATTDRIVGLVEAGVTEGKTISQIIDSIATRFSDVPNILERARTIARTETLTALSIGQAAAMADAATVIPGLKKMWINGGDNRVRGNPAGLYPDSKADHWKLQGQVQDHDKPFIDPRNGDKLMYPRAPGGKAESVINCRCTWVALPADEMEKINAG